MAVKMRLTRLGDKKSPFYRIVITDSRNARDGAYIDKVGHYNPFAQPAEIVLDVDMKQGEYSATAWGCDLTYDYVKINGDYRT